MSQNNQGEGNKEAAKEYNEATEDFVESGGVEDNADKHKNLSDKEKQNLEEAKEQAKDKARS